MSSAVITPAFAHKLPAMSAEDSLLFRRAYQVGFMGGEIRSALNALERGNVAWAIEHLKAALAVEGQREWKGEV